MIHYPWNAARAASKRPLRVNSKVTLLVGPGQLFNEDDFACSACGYHVHTLVCPKRTMNLAEAETFLRAAPEDNGVVALDGEHAGRVYFFSHEGMFMFLSPLRVDFALRVTARPANFPFVGHERNAERRFRIAVVEDHKNSK